MLTGTIVNTLAILVGSAVGMLISALASRFSDFLPRCGNLGFRLQAIINSATALCVLLIGVTGCMKGENTITAILSMVIGAIVGELLDLDRRAKEAGILSALICDAGMTEFHGQPTFTCLALEPLPPEQVDPLTGELPLY